MSLFTDAFSFPFRPFRRLWWFWLSLIPVLGWFLFAGYTADIIRHVVEKNARTLPPFGKFWPTLKIGLLYAVIALFFGAIAQFTPLIPVVGWVLWLVIVLLLPLLLVNYAVTRSFSKGFDVFAVTKLIVTHFGKYVVYQLCIIALALILLVASLPIVTLFVTLPAMSLSSSYLYARLYRECMRGKERKHPSEQHHEM